MANVGDKETFTIKVANLKPYSSYVVNISSYAVINTAGIQQIANQVVITDGGGNGTAAYEYSVTEEIFSIAQATSNINQITVLSKATINDIGEQYTSNEVSKQVRRGSGAPPITTPPTAPPPASNFRAVFSTYLGSTTQPHTEVPTSQRMGIMVRAGSVGVGVPNKAGYIGKTWALAIAVFPKSRVRIQIEVLDASGTIVLARTTESIVDTNGYNNGWVNTNGYTGIPANVLADGMNYIVRVVATNVNTGEVTRSGNYNASCFATRNYDTGA